MTAGLKAVCQSAKTAAMIPNKGSHRVKYFPFSGKSDVSFSLLNLFNASDAVWRRYADQIKPSAKYGTVSGAGICGVSKKLNISNPKIEKAKQKLHITNGMISRGPLYSNLIFFRWNKTAIQRAIPNGTGTKLLENGSSVTKTDMGMKTKKYRDSAKNMNKWGAYFFLTAIVITFSTTFPGGRAIRLSVYFPS
jgi:hypothetical protein